VFTVASGSNTTKVSDQPLKSVSHTQNSWIHNVAVFKRTCRINQSVMFIVAQVAVATARTSRLL